MSQYLNFRKLIRDCSFEILKSYSQRSDIGTPEGINSSEVIFADRMSLIMISNRALRLSLKVQYNWIDVFSVASNLHQNSSVTISDFFKEFCNQCIGGIKKSLEDTGLTLGISLPVSTRGFDDVFMFLPTNQTIYQDTWKLTIGTYPVFCISILEIMDPAAVGELENLKLSFLEDEGSVDLF